ncbi:serine hydrolase [Ornithinibacillus halotolerans]|uniref:Serine hydrolase n=1 Tax=Ornithinibacillus halotolerans TaxID=1274357 RepID=A0A916RZ05_9BACI|nr:serine hydrolase [Ornithinibacillus halotolerans]GGA77187.1 hypothetical protein GCM10008025_21020 [Ornithinibacillus halotolerans]
MIKFSSNANTDFLIEKLGADSINDVITDLELENHDPVYPIVSALLTSTYLKQQNDWSNDEIKAHLQSMSMDGYRSLVWEIHDKIKQGGQEFNTGQFSFPKDLQRIWSDRLPNATTEDYAKIMQAISNNEATIPGGDKILREIMEWPMELYESNREMYAHFGAKGGSTAFVLNQALYVEDHNGKKIEVVIFTEGLSFIEQIKMNRSMNSFLIKVLNEHL